MHIRTQLCRNTRARTYHTERGDLRSQTLSVKHNIESASHRVLRLRLNPSLFEQMTYVALSWRMGRGYELERPNHSHFVSRKQPGRGLLSQTKTIRFIARSCPNLQWLKVEPAVCSNAFGGRNCSSELPEVEGTAKLKFKHLEPLVRALSEVARNCPLLESVELPPVTTSIWARAYVDGWNWFPAKADEEKQRKYPYYGPITKILFDEITNPDIPESPVDATLDLKKLPWHSREEAVEKWARLRLTHMKTYGWTGQILDSAIPAGASDLDRRIWEATRQSQDWKRKFEQWPYVLW